MNFPTTSDPKHAGLRYNEGKLRYDLICPEQLKELARVYTIGAKKYGSHNWQKGQAWSTVLASLKRHIALFEQCQDNDDEPDTCQFEISPTRLNAGKHEVVFVVEDKVGNQFKRDFNLTIDGSAESFPQILKDFLTTIGY